MTSGIRELNYREAVREALEEELQDDPRVVLFGEDIARAGGVFKVTDGLHEKFGGLRVRDTPISENAILGAALGCAVAGFRPVVEIMFADFLANCFDQLVNHAAKWRFMSGGRIGAPMVVRTAQGGGISFGAQHSQCVASWLLPFPGLKIALPAHPADAKALLKAAIRDPDPVVVVEHKGLYGRKGPVPSITGEEEMILGRARITRPGLDVTVVGVSRTVLVAEEAADNLAADGISAEVIDLRTIAPMDTYTVVGSVRKTGHLVVVDDEPGPGGWGAGVITSTIDQAWEALAGPPRLIGPWNCPSPYSPTLEPFTMCTVEQVVQELRETVHRRPGK